MSEVMASPDKALSTSLGDFFSAPAGDEGGGQAEAPTPSESTTGGEKEPKEGEGQTGKESPGSTTADAAGKANPDAKEPADLPDEYKPFKQLIDAKKLDPKAKDFGTKVLGMYDELEKLTTRSNQEKSLLNTRQSELQRRLASDPKSVNEWRKLNGLPEHPVAKSFAEQAKEKAELFTHINTMLTSEDQAARQSSHDWLNKHFGDLNDLRARAAAQEMIGSKSADDHVKEFRGKASSVFTEHIARNPADEAVFNQYILPLTMPNGLLGSYGLDVAHATMTAEHTQAWAKIGKSLQLMENYDKALEEGIKKGVDEQMASKRKAGNASSVGNQGKQSAGASEGDEFTKSMWAKRHG